MRRVSTALLRVLSVGVLLLGVVLTPPVLLLLLGPVVGLAVTVVYALAHWSCCDEQWPAPRRLVDVTALGAGAVPWLQGLHVLGEVGLALGLLSAALLVLVVRSPERPPQVTRADGDDSLRQLLAVLPTDLLLREWRVQGATAAGPGALVLDELGRRDPQGVQRWRDAGAAGPLEPYLRPDHDRTC